jgi:hypothetical protein
LNPLPNLLHNEYLNTIPIKCEALRAWYLISNLSRKKSSLDSVPLTFSDKLNYWQLAINYLFSSLTSSYSASTTLSSALVA